MKRYSNLSGDQLIGCGVFSPAPRPIQENSNGRAHPNTQTNKQTIESADRAITAQDYDALMQFYAEDASLVVKPGLIVTGKASIRRAFIAIAEHFNHSIVVTQGKMQVIPGGDVTLVIMETLLHATDNTGR